MGQFTPNGVNIIKANFFINKEHNQAIVDAYNNYIVKKNWGSENDRKIIKEEYRTAEDMLLYIDDIDCVHDKNGNITMLDCEGIKPEYLLEPFNIIAPFVNENSYIEMLDLSSEENNSYLIRFVFKDGKCKLIKPIITWETEVKPCVKLLYTNEYMDDYNIREFYSLEEAQTQMRKEYLSAFGATEKDSLSVIDQKIKAKRFNFASHHLLSKAAIAVVKDENCGFISHNWLIKTNKDENEITERI